ncbi:MAG TPA: hypothetical protein VFE54_07100 [Mucilaginibacter sp.]|jgi:hypothetical protein|nr:hypothetical protein [Mucilaginibacter sp.]
MHLKKPLFLFLFAVSLQAVYGQSKIDTPKTHYKTYSNINDLRDQQAKDHITKLWYVDSLFNYRVAVPEWLKLKETNSRFMFGGTLAPVNGVENAIVIKAFSKKDYVDIQAFKDYVIGDWTYMTHPKWSSEALCYGQKELNLFENIGYCCRASNAWRNHIYTCTYVLVETKTAFLWIDYTSTPPLYDINEKKFEEFMNGFEKTNF